MKPLSQKHTKLRQSQNKRVLRMLLPRRARSRSTAFPSRWCASPGEVSITETEAFYDKKTEPADSVFLL